MEVCRIKCGNASSPACVNRWYLSKLWCKTCYTYLEHFLLQYYMMKGRDWKCLCKIRVVFISDGLSHAEKKIAQFDKKTQRLNISAYMKCTCKLLVHSYLNTQPEPRGSRNCGRQGTGQRSSVSMGSGLIWVHMACLLYWVVLGKSLNLNFLIWKLRTIVPTLQSSM